MERERERMQKREKEKGRESEREREKKIRRDAKTLKLWTRFSKELYTHGNTNNRDARSYVGIPACVLRLC